MSRRFSALPLGAAVSALSYAVLRPGAHEAGSRWSRVNHAGRSVTLLEGPAHVAGLVGGGLLAGPGPVVAALGGGVFGAVDDLAGDAGAKGLTGHLRAAARGQVTTGVVKIGGLAVTGLVSAALAESARPAASGGEVGAFPAQRTGGLTRLGRVLLGGAVVAGCANLLNLFDLRPGRALKVGMLLGAPVVLAGGPGATGASAAVGASLGVLAPDLRGEAMLGDTGANALGAVLGAALIEGRGVPGRLALLAGIAAVTLTSEKVSFTALIQRTPWLRALDEWGRPTT